MQFFLGALLPRLELGLEVHADMPRPLDDRVPEPRLRVVVGAQRRVHRRAIGQPIRQFVGSSAALVTPMPTWGRATKAASPSNATRPNTIVGDSRSKIAWKNGWTVRSSMSATGSANFARPIALMFAISSGRISGGAIAVPWQRPRASVHSLASASSRPIGWYHTKL